MNNHYTYAYLREDRTPYYIGRGTGNRVYSNHKHVPVPPRERILILKRNLTFEESCRHEIYMIHLFGRKCQNTGILINISSGGDGETHAEVTKSKIKTSLKRAWSEGRHHDMTGENNPNANGHHGEKNGRSKLTDEDRRQIALEYVPGKKTGHNGNCAELAERYEVGMSQIRRIARNPRWTF